MKVGDLIKYRGRWGVEMIGLVLAFEGANVLCYLKGKKMWLKRNFLEEYVI